MARNRDGRSTVFRFRSVWISTMQCLLWENAIPNQQALGGMRGTYRHHPGKTSTFSGNTKHSVRFRGVSLEVT